MTGTEIDVFEQRLSDLECLVFGDAEKDADYQRGEKLKSPCIDGLMDIHTKISSALTGKKKAALIFQKLPQLNHYLDHSLMDEMMLSSDAVAESIVAESDFIKRQVSLLQKLKDNQEHTNSEHIQGISQQAEKLQTLSKLHINQQDEVAQVTEETRRLLQAYNSIVTLLSQQFVLWDKTLTELESKPKK